MAPEREALKVPESTGQRGLVPEIYRTLFLLLAGVVMGGVVPIAGLFWSIHDQVTRGDLSAATSAISVQQGAAAATEHSDVEALKAQVSDMNQNIGQVKQTLRDHGYRIN